MNLKEKDVIELTKLTSQQIEHVTCAVCCKFYIAPETASCGHTLCLTCWSGRLKCAYCAKPVTRQSLKHNSPLQKLTEDAHALSEAFEKLFQVKIAELLMEVESEDEKTKNVRDWLASSQNHFTGPLQGSERLSQEKVLPCPLNVSSNKIQIHTSTSKDKSSAKVVYAPIIPQDDWDKIEPMPDTEDVKKDKENVVGPMDIEPFCFDVDNEYSHSNPRRSSRKRESKPDEKNKAPINKSLEKQTSKDSTEEIDKKTNKGKQHWINVKRMRKEFSKLNKKNRGKLNVSIEKFKKTQNTSKTMDVLPQAATFQYDIDENTPQNINKNELPKKCGINSENDKPKSSVSLSQNTIIINSNDEDQNATTLNNNEESDRNINNSEAKTKNTQCTEEIIQSSQHRVIEAESHINIKNTVKLPFYKKSSLCPKYDEVNDNQSTESNKATRHDVLVNSNTSSDEDVQIMIKVANTIANIVIKRKNDVGLQIKTDRAIQTSLDPLDTNEKSISSRNSQAQNILISVGDNNEIEVNHQLITNPIVERLKEAPNSGETGSNKKNTDSADTASAHFEITESVEKELSKVMDEEIDKVSKSASKTGNTKAAKDKSQKSAQPDQDMFDSESDVHLLKNTQHTPSILLCTGKTKNKTQNISQKRRKSTSDESTLPKSKKVKRNHVTTESKHIPSESESITYDGIMDTVFANIDADIEEIRQSQNIIKNTYTLSDKNKDSQHENRITMQENKGTQEKRAPRAFDVTHSSQMINNCNNQKDSENVFSTCVEKEMENVESETALRNKKVPINVPASNVEDFLTPVTSRPAAADDGDPMNDDSDRSVFEETPQKTSFTKAKPKSNGANKEDNHSQIMETSIRSRKSSELAHKQSIINVTDTPEAKGDNVTVINTEVRPTETPLNDRTFFDHIQHKSTPVAKKSLSFDVDPSLCGVDGVAETTQEKEFMLKAFEKTPSAPTVKPQSLRSLALKHKKYVIAGSCLNSVEITTLKMLCAQNKWTFTDKYTKELTHLVVGVDEENKAQRSVKYMSALASSIWIISYEWVEESMRSKDLVYEAPYEALDSTGHPGPRRSRLASKKLFQGISFFCKQPFSVLDVHTLKGMIESAGGRVVDRVEEVQVTEETTAPAIVLAEPENTQEDQFIYLAMELKVVPVNYEWALNCLGSYTLSSIQYLLLCPTALLPKPMETWPRELIARYDDDDE